EFRPASNSTYSMNPLRNETREVKQQRIISWFGFDLAGPARFSNQWCDEAGCTVSGLKRFRGISNWNSLRQFNLKGFGYPLPTDEEWKELPSESESARQPVTIND